MNTSVIWLTGLALGLAAGGCGAQIYKWTDAQGRVHYGDRKDAADGKPTQQVKVAPTPPVPPVPPSAESPAPPGWSWPARKASAPAGASAGPQAGPSSQGSESGGRENGSDASRCALARDVLDGKLRHGNGAPIDGYDREVAQGDVKRFCR
ncbi:DUF4124 domain-containing protein [Pelomonas cellulosilytica]|uniref:DUF4124 domain-containing protein n=1 Tax=Pelomonas cellulosilytica TaxID=2906762 RepID=A0ABS8XRC7_9BURK|nr:DUF4124 domain-containing protein [Pelomonas sp. P8]MCE4555279.1 DUF4124 domain-containing protein [Pelomonas sp. P8]